MRQVALTSELIRAARALLRWDQRQLAEASSVSLPTVKRLYPAGNVDWRIDSTQAALKRSLETAGIRIHRRKRGGPGVRLRMRQRPRNNPFWPDEPNLRTAARDTLKKVGSIAPNENDGSGVRLRNRPRSKK